MRTYIILLPTLMSLYNDFGMRYIRTLFAALILAVVIFGVSIGVGLMLYLLEDARDTFGVIYCLCVPVTYLLICELEQ